MFKKILAVTIISIAGMIVLGCQPAIKQYDAYISEVRSNLYEGNVGNISADAITGYREDPFEINGITANKKNFTVITIYPSEYNPSLKYSFKASIDGNEYSGDMIKHPFNNTYSCEIDTITSSNEIDFTLTHNSISNSTKLTSVVESDFIKADKALEIGVKKLNSRIRTLKNNNVSYEIYIRLLKNPVSSSGGYHWYVAFVGENDITYAVLIDPITLDIVAIRD